MPGSTHKPARCELCGREVSNLSKHHLIPRTRHHNKRNKRRFDRREVRERIAWLCAPCHRQIHALISEKEMEAKYSTVADLAAHPQVARFVTWLRARPHVARIATRRQRRR